MLRNSGRTWRSAGPSAWAAGIIRRDPGPRTFAKRSPLTRARRVSLSAPGNSRSRPRSEASWRANEPRASFEERTNSASRVSRWPSSRLRSPKFVIDRLMFSRRFARAPLMLGEVAGEGLEALQARRELAAAVAQALAGRLEQELEEGAGVAVQGGEDLVRLDVGLRAGEGERRALLDRLAAGAGVDLDRHVLEPRPRAQQKRGVRVDELGVLVVDLHGDDGAAAVELRPGHLADVDPGDGHRLPLPRRHRLRGAELRLELELVVADQGDPGREQGRLRRQDDPGGEQPQDDEDPDRHEVAQVLADRAPHGTASGLGGPRRRRPR